MPLVRIIVQTELVEVEPETEGLFAGCPRTSCRQLSRRQHFDVRYPQTVELYGETYKQNGFGYRPFNKKNPDYHIFVKLSDEQFSQFAAKAKAAGHRWRRGDGGDTDGRSVVRRLMAAA